MRSIAVLTGLAIASFAMPPSPALAGVCSGPLCGSFVQAVAAGTGGNVDRIDLDGVTAVQILGPVHAERLADVGNPGGEGNVSEDSAHLTADFPAGVLAIEMGTTTDAHDFGAIITSSAAGRVFYDEELAIGSATLPAGTDVTVRLRYRIAYGTALAHSLGESIVATYNYDVQYADVQMEATASLDNHFGGSDFDQSFWNVYYGLSSTVTGVFADPVQVGEVATTVKTGQNLHLHIYLNGNAGSEAGVYGQYPPYVFPVAASAGTVAMVFGLEADQPGVTITSPSFGTMPGFSGVTAANAYANALPVDVGGPVAVPEPAAATSGCVACTALLARRRRDANRRRARRSAHITSHSSR